MKELLGLLKEGNKFVLIVVFVNIVVFIIKGIIYFFIGNIVMFVEMLYSFGDVVN